MQLSNKIYIGIIFIIIILTGCKDEYTSIVLLSGSNNPLSQDIDNELGRRYTRTLENIESINFYYKYGEDRITDIIKNNQNVNILKYTKVSEIVELINDDLIKPLPEIIQKDIIKKMPESIASMCKINENFYIIPYSVELYKLFFKDQEEVLSFKIKKDLDLLRLLELFKTINSNKTDEFLLNQFKENYINGLFSSNNPTAYFTTEPTLEIINNFKESDVFFASVYGYVPINNISNSFLQHLISEQTADYLLRRKGHTPLLANFNLIKLNTQQKIEYEIIQSNRDIKSFKIDYLTDKEIKNEINTLKEFLNSIITYEDYIKKTRLY